MGSILQIGNSQNTICAIWISFPKSICVICKVCMYLTVVKKVRFGDNTTLSCPNSMTSGSYSWIKDGVPITAQTRGIVSDTIYTSNLTIISMTQQLVGIYQCLLNYGVRGTFDVNVVGRLFYYIFRMIFIIILYRHSSIQHMYK